MLTIQGAFSGFSAPDIDAERTFYADKLGITVQEGMGNLMLELPGGQRVIVYPKPDHQPASFTVLNFDVADIDAAADELAAAGVELERYEGFDQDERGIARENGPSIAWFKDPAGNILSILHTD
jgi:catechol 2,3-dioxygenase-like lactoylglutathione lyase family enzyme